MTEPLQRGAGLCQRFYWQAVRPILDAHFPGLAHAAALIDSGSEVLGFDDAQSIDHHWGPRALLFLSEADHPRQAALIAETLARELPLDFEGYPTSFTPPNAGDNGVQLLERVTAGPVHHRVEVHTLRGFWRTQLAFDLAEPLAPADWLTFPQQRLRCLTEGPVFHDEIGLRAARERFAYYPRDVWLYLLAAGWTRIGQEEHLMGRAGQAGDELGSAIIGARLARDVMRLAFLMERRYGPYPKWFGAAFQQLTAAERLGPPLWAALRAATWIERQAALVTSYELLAQQHNALGLTAPLPEQARDFFGRPFRVMALHGFADALLAEVRDPAIARLAQRPLIGSLDLWSDNTDMTADPLWRPMIRKLYED